VSRCILCQAEGAYTQVLLYVEAAYRTGEMSKSVYVTHRVCETCAYSDRSREVRDHSFRILADSRLQLTKAQNINTLIVLAKCFRCNEFVAQQLDTYNEPICSVCLADVRLKQDFRKLTTTTQDILQPVQRSATDECKPVPVDKNADSTAWRVEQALEAPRLRTKTRKGRKDSESATAWRAKIALDD